MKATFAKVAGIALLGAITWMSTTHLLARRGLARTAPPVPQHSTWAVPLGFVEGEKAPDVPAPLGPGVVSSGGASDFVHETDGRILRLSMTPGFRDSRADMRYVCWIRVTPVGQPETTLFRHVFEDRILQAEGELARGDFHEFVEIPLDAGGYDLLVHWNGLPPGKGLEALDEPATQAFEEHLVACVPIAIP